MKIKERDLGDISVSTAKDIGKAIRARRKMHSITQEQAAGMCNVGVRFLSELENGKPTLEIEKVMRVLEAFGFQCVIRPRG